MFDGYKMDFVTSSSSTTTSLTPAETLFRLCQIWSVLHNRSSPIPSICKGVGSASMRDQAALDEFERHLRNNDLIVGNEATIDSDRPPVMKKDFFDGNDKDTRMNNYRYTTRSLSVIGVLGGIVLILLITALSACVRHRRNLLIPVYPGDNGHESFARQILIDQLRHINRSRQNSRAAAREPPPSYDDVVKPPEVEGTSEEEEAEPPSYLEATAAVLASSTATTLASSLGSSSASGSANALASQVSVGTSTTIKIEYTEAEEDGDSSKDDAQVTVNGRKVSQTVVQINEDEISAVGRSTTNDNSTQRED